MYKQRSFEPIDRKSASLMHVLVVNQNYVIGIISIQSYIYNRYNNDDLALLERIAEAIAPALARTYIQPTLDADETKYEDEYFVDDEGIEFSKLLQSIKNSNRISDDNKVRFEIILTALKENKGILKKDIEALMVEKGLSLPTNLSDFITKRLNNIASQHGFVIDTEGNAYRLFYRPRAKAIIFFATDAGDAEHLVRILRQIDRSDREQLNEKGIRIVEAGGIVGDEDVFCVIEAQTLDLILSETIRKSMRSFPGCASWWSM